LLFFVYFESLISSTSGTSTNSTTPTNSTVPATNTTPAPATNTTPAPAPTPAPTPSSTAPKTVVDAATELKCVDYTTRTFGIGDNITFCVHFIPRKLRMAFNLNVDEYSVVTVTGAAYFVLQDSIVNSVYFISQLSNYTNDYMAQYFSATKFMIPVFNLVIKMKLGKILGIVWDNDCYTCPVTPQCINQTALNVNSTDIVTKYYDTNCNMEICDTKNTTGIFQCDPKFYITFWGTDKDNRPFQSAGLAMSRFRQYNVASLYTSAKSAFDVAIKEFTNTFNDISNKTNAILDDIKKTFTG